MSGLWGVNGESTGGDYTNWGKPARQGPMLQAIVKFVDQTRITVRVNDTAGFEAVNDGRGPRTQMNEAASAVATAIAATPITVEQMNTFNANLTSALGATSSRYDLAKVKTLLTTKGLTLAQIAGLAGKTGDDLIKAIIELLDGANAASYLTGAGAKEAELNALLANTSATKAQIQSAITALQTAGNYVPELYNATIATANDRIRTIDVQATAAAETARQTAQTAFTRATNLNELLNAMTANQGAIDANPALKIALGARALVLLQEKWVQNVPSVLNPYIRQALPANQELVSFIESANGGVATNLIIEKAANGITFTIVGKPGLGDPPTYYIEEGATLRDNQITISRSVSGLDDHFTARVVDLRAPAAAGGLPADFYVRFGITDANRDGVIDIYDIDTDRNGEITAAEAERAGINARLFRVIDQGMLVNGVNGDGKIVWAELLRLNETAVWFAERTGRNVDTVLLLYRTQGLSDVSRSDVDGAYEQMRGTLTSALNGQALSSNNLESVLQGCSFADYMIKSILVDFQNQANIDINKVLQAIILRTLASRSTPESQRHDWGLSDAAVINSRFPAGANFTTQNIVNYACGRQIQTGGAAGSAGGASGTSGTGDRQITNENAIRRLLARMRAADDPEQFLLSDEGRGINRNPEALDHVGHYFLGAGRVDLAKAIAYAQRLAETSDTPRSNQLNKDLLGVLTTAKEWNKAIELLTAWTTDPQRPGDLQSLIEATRYLPTQEARDVALSAAQLLVTVVGEQGQVIIGNQPIAASAYLTQIKEEQRMPLNIYTIRASVLSQPSNPNIGTAADAIAKLKVIIDLPATSAVDRAYALLVRAEILQAQGNSLPGRVTDTTNTAKKAKYEEMAQAARLASLAFMALSSRATSEEDRNYYTNMSIRANDLIARIAFSFYADATGSSRPGGGRNSDTGSRTPYMNFCKMILQYIPAGSSVHDLQSDQNNPTVTSSDLIKTRFTDSLARDQEHRRDQAALDAVALWATASAAGGVQETPASVIPANQRETAASQAAATGRTPVEETPAPNSVTGSTPIEETPAPDPATEYIPPDETGQTKRK
jgi:hypothetical protein